MSENSYPDSYSTFGIHSYLKDIYCDPIHKKSFSPGKKNNITREDYPIQRDNAPEKMQRKKHPSRIQYPDQNRRMNYTDEGLLREIQTPQNFRYTNSSLKQTRSSAHHQYRFQLEDALDKIDGYEMILTKIGSFIEYEEETFDLLPVSLSRVLSKQHYDNYIKSSGAYQKLKRDMNSLQQLSFDALTKYRKRDKTIELLRTTLGQIFDSFNNDTEYNFSESGLSDSARDKPGFSQNEAFYKEEQMSLRGDEEDQPDGEVGLINIANFTNELTLMAVEQFNNISNQLTLTNLKTPDDEKAPTSDNLEVLDQIDSQLKKMEDFFATSPLLG